LRAYRQKMELEDETSIMRPFFRKDYTSIGGWSIATL
jgi:hypothetical protein